MIENATFDYLHWKPHWPLFAGAAPKAEQSEGPSPTRPLSGQGAPRRSELRPCAASLSSYLPPPAQAQADPRQIDDCWSGEEGLKAKGGVGGWDKVG